MKRLLVVLLVVVAAVAGALAIPAFGSTRHVKIGDNFFSPKTLTVRHGTTVVWRWSGAAPHNVTVTRAPKNRKFHSRTQTSGTFKATPHTRGTYRIVCTIHAGMSMTLKVR